MSQPDKTVDYVARSAMVNGQILPHGVRAPAVLSAFGTVPRENFLPDPFQNRAYSDAVVPLGSGRWILPPMIMAQMIEAANITPNDHLLTLGCGTGYMAALLSLIGRDVVGVDTDSLLIDRAIAVCEALPLGLSVSFKMAPLTEGYAPMGPYDGIFLEGCVPHCPPFIADQLTVGGRAVMIEKNIPGPLWGEGVLYEKQPSGMKRTFLFTLPAPCLSDFYTAKEAR